MPRSMTSVGDLRPSTQGTNRAWVQGVHDAFAATGMVQPEGLEQLDISTVGDYDSSVTVLGHETWAFADDLQATAPVFVWVEYRNNDTSTIGISITVGTGVDETGTITGTILSGSYTGTTVTSGGSSVYGSGDGSGGVVLAWPDGPSAATWSLIVDRSRDGSGVPTGDGLAVFLNVNNAQTTSFMVTTLQGGSYTAGIGIPSGLPGGANGSSLDSSFSLSVDGTTVPAFPVAFAAPGVPAWVTPLILAVAPGDGGLSIGATINGQARNFRSVSSQVGAYNQYYRPLTLAPYGTVTSYSRVYPAILWEE